MKTLNTMLAGLAAVALTTNAAADTVIRLTGSTAFRSNTHAALVAASPTGLGFTQTAYTLASASGAKYAIYEKGTTPTKITIKTSWTGSVAGILTVVQQRTDVKWLPDVGTGSVVAGSGNAEALAATDGTPPDIAFSDAFQSSTVYKTPALTDVVCGLNQFRYVTNYGPGGVNPITSVNSQQLRALFGSATGLPLSVFTGNAADTARVYALGRDADSGTRVTALAESGFGANATVIHWSPTLGSTTVDALAPWPATTLFGTSYAIGNGGYASGGDLAKAMRYDTNSVAVNGGAAAPCYFIAAVGKSDAVTVTAAHNPPTTVGAGPGKVIAYNNADGPAALDTTNLPANIKSGKHSFWSYLHCMHNGLSGDKLTFYGDLTTLLRTSDSSGIILTDMKVERLSDGGVITVK